MAHADEDVSSRFELNVGAEATLVGLTFGARPELLVRPGRTPAPSAAACGVRFPVVRQFGVYLETGLGIAFSERWSIGAMFEFDLMLLGGPGIGFGPRIYAGHRF